MMIVLMAAAICGGAISFVIVFPYGGMIAGLSMPLGGSLLALLVACLLYSRSSRSGKARWGRGLGTTKPQFARAVGKSSTSTPHPEDI
jgi:hypothetical protein